MAEPPEDRPEARPFAPDALFMVLTVVAAIAAMLHPLLFAIALTAWGVYIFHRVLSGSRQRRLGERARAALPGAAESPAVPPTDTADQALLQQLLAQPPAATRRPGQADAPRPPLRWRDWTALVLKAPNVLIVGAPASGKTLLVRALLPLMARQGQIAILDPHSCKAEWPWPAIGAGRDYDAIIAALEVLVDEMTARYQHGDGDPRLTIVIDEVPAIVSYRGKDWARLYPQLVFEGRKAAIHTLMLAQSGQVKPLGLEGKGDLRESLLRIFLGDHAIAEDPSTARMARPAFLRWGTIRARIDLSHVPTYARLPIDESARWELPDMPPPDVPLDVPPRPRRPRRPRSPRPEPAAPRPASAAPPAPDSLPPDAAPEAAVPHVTSQEQVSIKILHERGHTPSAIARLLPGYTPKRYRAYKAKVDYVLRMLKEEAHRTNDQET